MYLLAVILFTYIFSINNNYNIYIYINLILASSVPLRSPHFHPVGTVDQPSQPSNRCGEPAAAIAHPTIRTKRSCGPGSLAGQMPDLRKRPVIFVSTAPKNSYQDQETVYVSMFSIVHALLNLLTYSSTVCTQISQLQNLQIRLSEWAGQVSLNNSWAAGHAWPVDPFWPLWTSPSRAP